jgi:hypothetical protein
MRFLKYFLTFLFFLSWIMFVLVSCGTDNEGRDLSTPSSRLVGHWIDSRGYHLYFYPVDPATKTGSYILVYPGRESIIKEYEEYGEELEKMEKNYAANKDIERLSKQMVLNDRDKALSRINTAIHREYKILSEEPDGKFIDILILYTDLDDDLRATNTKAGIDSTYRVNFLIDKNGKQMIREGRGGFLYDGEPRYDSGTIVSYIDSNDPEARAESIAGAQAESELPVPAGPIIAITHYDEYSRPKITELKNVKGEVVAKRVRVFMGARQIVQEFIAYARPPKDGSEKIEGVNVEDVFHVTDYDAYEKPKDPRWLCLDYEGNIIEEHGKPVLVKRFSAEQRSTSSMEYDGSFPLRRTTKIFSCENCSRVTGVKNCRFVF